MDSGMQLVWVIIIIVVMVILLTCLGVGIWLCIKYGFPGETDKADEKEKNNRKHRKSRRRRDDEADDDSVAVSTTRHSRFDRYRRRRRSRDDRRGSRDRHRSQERQRSKEHSSRHPSRSSRHRGSREARRSSRSSRHKSADLSQKSHHSRRRSKDRIARLHDLRHRTHRESPDLNRRKSHHLSETHHSRERKSSNRDNHMNNSQKQLMHRKTAEKKRSLYNVSSRELKAKDDQTKWSRDDNILLDHHGPHSTQVKSPPSHAQVPSAKAPHFGKQAVTSTAVRGSQGSSSDGQIPPPLAPQALPKLNQHESDSEETSEVFQAPQMSQQQIQMLNRVPGASPNLLVTQPPSGSYQHRLPPGVPMIPIQAIESESESEESSESSLSAISEQVAVTQPTQQVQQQQRPSYSQPMPQQWLMPPSAMMSQATPTQQQYQQPIRAAPLHRPPAPLASGQPQWTANAHPSQVVPLQQQQVFPAQQQQCVMQQNALSGQGLVQQKMAYPQLQPPEEESDSE